MLSKLVREEAKNTGSVTVEEVENHYLLLQVGPGGKRVGVQNVPKNLVLGHCVLDALIDQKTNPTNQLKRKLDAAVGRRTDMDADRQEAATRNVRQRVR